MHEIEENPKVTVAIACYNSEKYIKYAIQSVLEQSYKNWELVIVDDGSTDKSVNVIRKTIKKINKANLIIHDKNYGCGRSKKDAVENGDGSLICILDSDDALTPDAVKVMVNTHKANPDASMCYSRYYNCAENLTWGRNDVRGSPLPKNTTFLMSKSRIKVSHLKCFKRSFYDMTEGFNPNLLKAVDKDIILKMEEVGKLVFINRPLYYRRIHNKSLTKMLKLKHIDKRKLDHMRSQIFTDARNRRKNPSMIARSRKFAKKNKLRAVKLEEML